MYYVIELQTNVTEDGLVPSFMVTSYANKNDALSKYYGVLSFAAKSEVSYHAAAVLDEYGGNLKNEYFEHLDPIE